MERWCNKVAVVTGASSGIGLAIIHKLLKNGMIVVALARREERLKEIHASLESDLRLQFYPRKCDVTQVDQVHEVFKWIKESLGGIDVLVNNAGILRTGRLTDPGHLQNIRDVIDTNIMGVVHCTQEAFASMKERNFDGHVIIITSTSANLIPTNAGHLLNMYPASKSALKAMVELYRQEFLQAQTRIKITDICPGIVETEMTERFPKFKLRSEDVADAVVYAIDTPVHVQLVIERSQLECIVVIRIREN